MSTKRPVGPGAIRWWRQALVDGSHAYNKRRGSFYAEYLANAAELLRPGELEGPFSLIYRMGFREGYDSAKVKRALDNTYYAKPKKRGKLAR